ncbi:MAG: hypothetical protein IJJ71_06770 [Treponema sp.]|uniref:hypothetical protein n=1 Tax=Treponema sp. TaxID=166 RepID=UPI0025FCDE1E|nr:hypothetical protein [Treponema sp.]MBR0495856.1 hypothetical protein [Treponema sp.]
MKKFLTIPLACAVFLLALSCKNSQKSSSAKKSAKAMMPDGTIGEATLTMRT